MELVRFVCNVSRCNSVGISDGKAGLSFDNPVFFVCLTGTHLDEVKPDIIFVGVFFCTPLDDYIVDIICLLDVLLDRR